jgi:hypothetical protein
MIYLKDIENSTRALTRAGYRNKSYTRLNKLKSLNIDYVMTSDVFLKYAWLVGMNQYRRFYTSLDFNLSKDDELYRDFELKSKHKLINEFKLGIDRILVSEILDEQEFKKEQKIIRNFLKSNSVMISIYSSTFYGNSRNIDYVVLGKDAVLYTFNGYKGLLALITERLI